MSDTPSSAALPSASSATPHRLMQKGWATQLFAAELPQASIQLRTEIELALDASMSAFERFRLTEVCRVLVMGLHNRWRRLSPNEGQAFSEDVALWRALWAHYSLSLRALLDGDPGLAPHKAFFLQQALFISKQLRLIHALAQKPFPAELWKETHAYYRFSEILQCSFENVTDKLLTTENRVSCYSTYLHTLLIDLANLSALSPQQILWMDRWLPRLARKAQPVDISQAQIGLFLAIRLDNNRGGALRARVKPSSAASLRIADLNEIAKTLRRRRRHLITGETPARVKLGEDISSDQATALLAHLEAAWCPPDLSHVPDAPQFDDWTSSGTTSA
ncbi:MAG: hypothetical protein LBE75_04850 [Burkholderiales bacterium]|jgi:hypothetical protein|nr:hypothetical protein [Burkholderiales bacterium]